MFAMHDEFMYLPTTLQKFIDVWNPPSMRTKSLQLSKDDCEIFLLKAAEPSLPTFASTAVCQDTAKATALDSDRYIVTVLTSSSSGYMTWNSNVSDSSSPFSCRNFFVPDDNLIMVSFKELNPVYSGIKLKDLPCDMGSFLNTTDVPVHTIPFIWKRQRDIHSDFVQLRNVRQVNLEVFVPNCVNTACFRLYFTFLPEDKKPAKLANGFWNCSVEHYASFHHNLACNLKTDCEDGRNETGDCPYSSPHCNGLIVLCGRCYTVVTNVNDLSSFKTDVNKMGNDYCSSLGGRLGIPKCVYNWRQVIRHMTKINPHRMNYLLTGLNTEDRLLPNMVCDYMFHCQDQSDEKVCEIFRVKAKHKQASFLPPVLVQFDGAIYFTSSTMNVSEPCPDSHFRCPGNFNDCLPVYTRCNLMYDCIGHEDEEGCEELTCPGFFRCRLSKLCLHSDHVCDGWSHCPMSDDELSCDIICPVNCLCQGYTFQCPQPFSASLFPQLRYLDVTGSGMTLHDVSNNTMLVGIVFAHCSLILLHKTQLVNLKYLDLSYNKLYTVNLAVFLGLENLQTLSLSNNPLTSISVGPPSDRQYSDLQALDLSFTTLAVLETRVFSVVPGLKKLNLTSTSIHTISPDGFQLPQHLTELFMDGSFVKTFPSDIFKDLSSLRYISPQNYKLCCSEILPYNFDQSNCIAARDEISSCEDLLQSWTYRGFLGLIACLSLMGNAACCCARFFASSLASSSGFSVFVTNLTVADFLMGVYIAIIGVADHQFHGKYLCNDDMWKNSATCKGAICLSLLSSEVSVLIIWFITLDRFIVLHFPFNIVRFDKTSAAVASLFIWLAGFLLAVLPLLPKTSHWQFYSQTGICIPLPVTRHEFKGRVYSFSVLITHPTLQLPGTHAGRLFLLDFSSAFNTTHPQHVLRKLGV
ncbi:hypothetical protein ACOMHN_025674 [Nucella lapillus]